VPCASAEHATSGKTGTVKAGDKHRETGVSMSEQIVFRSEIIHRKASAEPPRRGLRFSSELPLLKVEVGTTHPSRGYETFVQHGEDTASDSLKSYSKSLMRDVATNTHSIRCKTNSRLHVVPITDKKALAC
jgi:hypothetical protein